jgi:hypothetical protein
VSSASCEDHPLHEVLQAAPDARLPVVLTLRSEDVLSVAELQHGVLDSLDGADFEVLRQPANFPILALRVGEEAFCRLVGDERVANIQEDKPEAPTGL